MPDLTMSSDELDTFLTEERVVRLATVDDDGWPVVVPLWFVWHDGALWVWNLNRARRTRRLEEGARCGFVVDGGIEYVELVGAAGRAEPERVDDADVPEAVRLAYARKYFRTDVPVEPVHHHTWFRLRPSLVRSWDFTRLAGG